MGSAAQWVWSRLDQTPFADALEPLARLTDSSAIATRRGGAG